MHHYLHTFVGFGGVELDDLGTGTDALHIEVPGHLLQRHFIQRENFGDEAVLIQLQTHQALAVDGVDHLAILRLQGDFLSVEKEANLEVTVCFQHTGGHAALGLTGIQCAVQVPVDLIALGSGGFGGGHRGGGRRLTAGALGQHQRQQTRQHNKRCHNADNERFSALFHRGTS